jgi:hypothetical protein
MSKFKLPGKWSDNEGIQLVAASATADVRLVYSCRCTLCEVMRCWAEFHPSERERKPCGNLQYESSFFSFTRPTKQVLVSYCLQASCKRMWVLSCNDRHDRKSQGSTACRIYILCWKIVCFFLRRAKSVSKNHLTPGNKQETDVDTMQRDA